MRLVTSISGEEYVEYHGADDLAGTPILRQNMNDLWDEMFHRFDGMLGGDVASMIAQSVVSMVRHAALSDDAPDAQEPTR